jgi:hypothetical protein
MTNRSSTLEMNSRRGPYGAICKFQHASTSRLKRSNFAKKSVSLQASLCPPLSCSSRKKHDKPMVRPSHEYATNDHLEKRGLCDR